MTRFLFALALVLGAVAAIWITLMLPTDNPVAMVAMALIALVYGTGFTELWRYRQDTGRFERGLQAPPTSDAELQTWLARLPASLRTPTQRRIDGERAPLPGPSLTPYLTGLLVMLGLLGTFIGMIVTLRGAASALQGGADLHAIRGALAAPIAGMSLAFGTSIAGVATSAMLGLAASLSRRDRQLASRRLDHLVAAELQPFSARRRREQVWQVLQEQAQAFPAIIERLEALGTRMGETGEQLGRTLLDNQSRFHDRAQAQHGALAERVGTSLERSLAEGSRQAAESLQPLMAAALRQFQQQTERTHQHLGDLTQAHLTDIGARFQATTEQAAQSWHTGLDRHQQSAAQLSESFASALRDHDQRLSALTEQYTARWQVQLDQQQHSSNALVRGLGDALDTHSGQFRDTTATLAQQQQSGLQSLLTQTGEALAELRDQEAQRAQAATDRLAALEKTVAQQLTALGTELEEPMARLMDSASDAPRAASELIRTLRTEMAGLKQRDNELLEERQRLLGEFDALLRAQKEEAAAERQRLTGLTRQATRLLEDADRTFSAHMQAQSDRLDQATAEITGSGHEVASLGEAFAAGTQSFGAANDKLIDSLDRIEKALIRVNTRSDEQLAYYVEQAREIIDLSLASQQERLDELGDLRADGEG